MKIKAVIFLNGYYHPDHHDFYVNEYRESAGDSVIIVTDGGLRFFMMHNLRPDIIVGDMDSIDDESNLLSLGSDIITVSAEGKTSTDGELALDWCATNRISEAVLYGGIDTTFETDHLLGNIFMMFAFMAKIPTIKMRDYCQEIIPLDNGSCSGDGKPGDMLSVIPLSEEIVYQAEGLKYNPAGGVYKFGRTIPLRNELVSNRFAVEIKGRAIVIRHF